MKGSRKSGSPSSCLGMRGGRVAAAGLAGSYRPGSPVEREEPRLDVERGFARGGGDPFVGSVREQASGVDGVAEVGGQDLVPDVAGQGGVLDGEDDLDPAVQ